MAARRSVGGLLLLHEQRRVVGGEERRGGGEAWGWGLRDDSCNIAFRGRTGTEVKKDEEEAVLLLSFELDVLDRVNTFRGWPAVVFTVYCSSSSLLSSNSSLGLQRTGQ